MLRRVRRPARARAAARPSRRSAPVDAAQLARFRPPAGASRERRRISQEEWDAANAAFHEFQIDLAGNDLLSRFYRELSVNLMMQVIRGGELDGGRTTSAASTARSSRPTRRATSARRRAAIRAHIDTGKRIALEAIERAGGVL